ncbi:sensor histidine kinase [Methylomonas sp. MED-D]|uniref:sensor histidine kinase n=1 Tax=unclassified Methylomonas TaxID=2608980 RepID=UPI0028A326B8|nr:ATP-binding protein [Methylomonas sp. MV1]MDT4330148.1 ATP-binding protein [Methylomonas sp. MV1]
MPPGQTHTYYPCPFSRGYGIPERQAWLMLKIFAIYRFMAGSLFVMLFYLRFGASTLGTYDNTLYQFASLGYLAISVVAAPITLRHRFGYAMLAQMFIFTDIVFITLMMHASGGIASGIGMLLAISIAAGGLLIGGRCAILFAALASLAVLAEQVYAIQTRSFEPVTLTYSGMLGISFFSIAFLSVILAQRAEQSAILAQQQAQTIARLEGLNRYIIQHLQSGILIVDGERMLQLANQSALRLLDLADIPPTLADLAAPLQEAFGLWRDNPEQDFAILHLSGDREIQVRFSVLSMDGEALYLLIIEDIALYNQRLQQSKLASLGRLTASIAHEIRNPLSAISHAGQLLSEAPGLPAQEVRLTEIIQNHCQRVNCIIEDILKLSRRHFSHKQKINLDAWLTAYFSEQKFDLGGRADAFALAFVRTGLTACIDDGHLKQILDNLCANALQYGRPEAGKIRVVVDLVDEQPTIKVIDNGPGIGGEHLTHLFEPFFTTSHKGTGLGLYISKALAELNQADLGYVQDGGKSCFVLALANAENTVIEI